MMLSSKFPEINFVILMGFVFAFCYTEITEYHARIMHQQEVDSFMAVGNRFTHEDGDVLREEIAVLRGRIDELEKR